MLASLETASLVDPNLVYEPKYDGIRAIAEITPEHVRLWSRLGNEKTRQFPEIAEALTKWAQRHKARVVVDGEIVALDSNGHPAGFQQLQGRINLSDGRSQAPGSAAYIVFDVLSDEDRDLRDRPLLERREVLERVFSRTGSPLLRISELVRGDARALHEQAVEQGWEGLIAKQAASTYKSGKRTPDWRKLKILHEQEFVIGGWTDPRESRTYFGALLVGVYERAGRDASSLRAGRAGRVTKPKDHGQADRLVYVGHVGTGFSQGELERVMKRLKPLETRDSPFQPPPKTNEDPHWVRPELVAQVKFTEWTADGNLRHPVYLGLRDDKRPSDVHREEAHGAGRDASSPSPGRAGRATGAGRDARSPRAGRALGKNNGKDNDAPIVVSREVEASLLQQLQALEDAKRDGTLSLPGGDELAVTNLQKMFWPKQKLTKGDLFRYYVRVASVILPALADRPLVMKRYPNGIAGKWFYQHRAPDQMPPGIRVEKFEVGGSARGSREEPGPPARSAAMGWQQRSRRASATLAGSPARVSQRDGVPAGGAPRAVVDEDEIRDQIIGGTLKTLLYTTQLAAISQDPWFSRVTPPGARSAGHGKAARKSGKTAAQFADHVALDLDPSEGVPFKAVLDVARWIREVLDRAGAIGVPKTSGADGLHVYIPLPPETPYDAGLLFAQIIATLVTQKHGKTATMERSVRARGKRVYIDTLQNILGKTLASAYSARASDYAGVSTPLSWQEVEEGVDPHEFTIDTMPDRLAKVGDLWRPLWESRGVDLEQVTRMLGGHQA